MSLPKREIRVWVTEDVYKVLNALCGKRGVTLTQFCESYLTTKVRSIAEESIVVAEAAKESGMFRSKPDTDGVAAQQKGNGDDSDKDG